MDMNRIALKARAKLSYASMNTENTCKCQGNGASGSYLVYFTDGICTLSRVSLLPLFFTLGIKRRQFFYSRFSKGVFCNSEL